MQPHPRKLITIVTEAVIEQQLLKDLQAQGVSAWTISDARGRGKRGIRNAGWDQGANIRLEIVCDATLAERIADFVRQQYYDNFAMVLFISDVQVLRPEKF